MVLCFSRRYIEFIDVNGTIWKVNALVRVGTYLSQIAVTNDKGTCLRYLLGSIEGVEIALKYELSE